MSMKIQSWTAPSQQDGLNAIRRRRAEATTPKGRAAQLRQEADALDREARRMEGTSWVGAISPSQSLRDEARQKRRDAEWIEHAQSKEPKT